MMKKGDGDFFLTDKGYREGYQHGQRRKKANVEIKYWRQLCWRDDLSAYARRRKMHAHREEPRERR